MKVAFSHTIIVFIDLKQRKTLLFQCIPRF
jgi:hypothetical protein